MFLGGNSFLKNRFLEVHCITNTNIHKIHTKYSKIEPCLTEMPGLYLETVTASITDREPFVSNASNRVLLLDIINNDKYQVLIDFSTEMSTNCLINIVLL